MQRIQRMGGHVTPAGANGSPARVWHKLRGLAMSRSIGDHNAASVGVISKPDITEHTISDDDVALVAALQPCNHATLRPRNPASPRLPPRVPEAATRCIRAATLRAGG